jgi:hypothetical protein
MCLKNKLLKAPKRCYNCLLTFKQPVLDKYDSTGPSIQTIKFFTFTFLMSTDDNFECH